MSRRFLTVAAVVALALAPMWGGVAFAQEAAGRVVAPNLFNVPANLADASVAAVTPVALDAPNIPFSILHGRPEQRGSNTLASLYASTALLQVLDVHSTLTAIGHGAVEGNPMMAGLTQHRAGFIAVKGAIAASTIFAMKSLAKRHKLAAIATLIGINSAYALVVSHNYQVARGR